MDRNNVGAARLKGFQDDLNLTDTQYNTVLSILYTSYITLQVPSNLFMAKIGKPSIYLPICVGLWGTISALTSLCHTFGQTIAVRIFLGFVEAAFFPGALYLLSKWYTKKELATRTALLYSGSIISNAFSGLIGVCRIGSVILSPRPMY